MRRMALALIFSAQWASAQASEDVIYKKDGSILRGTLVEQDLENGKYKIQLKGGSIFSISKTEIIKISKETLPNSTGSSNNGVNIHIENNPNINLDPHTQEIQRPPAETSPPPSATSHTTQQPLMETYHPSVTRDRKHSIRIGAMKKELVDSDETGLSYQGANIAYQYNFDKHLALYSELNTGDIDNWLIAGREHELPTFIRNGSRYQGVEASVMLSTNNYYGWQFYGGIGLFSENYTFPDRSNNADGAVATLGMGYSWKALQVQLRGSLHNSSDYKEDYSSNNFTFQLAFNF